MKKVPVNTVGPCARLLLAAALVWPGAAAWAQTAAAAEPVFDVYEYVIEGNTLLPSAVVERIVAPFMGPERRFSDVEQARSALEKAYQDAGYLSVVVSLPNQQVDRGEVRLEVVEAPLGKVTVTGAEHNLPSRIQAAVPALKEGTVPHFPSLQKQLAEVQSAQLQVTPLVNASEGGQGIDVDLKVEDKSPFFGSVQYSNAQSYNTSRGRISASVGTNNLFQRGHTLGLSWQYAPYRPKDSNVFSLLYGVPLSGRDDLMLSATHSNSDTLTRVSGTGPSSTLTKGDFYGLRWTRRLSPLNWPVRHSVYAAVDYKHNRDFNTFKDGQIVQRPPTRYSLFGAGYSLTHNGAGDVVSTLSTSAKLSSNSFGGRKVNCDGVFLEQFDCKRAGASADFAAVQIAVGHARPVLGNWRLNLSADVQLATGALPSSEQYALGGNGTLRGYYDYEQTGDDGWNSRIELVSPVWLNVGSIRSTALVFADRGFVHIINPQLTQVSRTHMGSVGLGLRFFSDSGLQAGLDLSRVNFDTQRPTDNGARAFASGPKADRRYRLDLSVQQSF
ncbi:MAG: ShlB/FhaC/HecB family hemolysin secretion/activation protein [Proteobacteria bacterium]|uniref:ShlB/FhaC/HecB family hemolysin secretion/activation protein n=1 Tax=Aquabacterium sp. TaxID=1872578 RepID=UPI0035C6ED45|nr:ShlB/FhaC/HecB family hemolysin secretion/activation protein [Pseudomonadota bacterium]